MNDILIRNSSSLRPYLPYIRPQTPISTNGRKTIRKPIIEQPSLSKKTDNFKQLNHVNNHKKSKRSTSSLNVSRGLPTTDQYQNPTIQTKKEIELNKVSIKSHFQKGKNIILLRKKDNYQDFLYNF